MKTPPEVYAALAADGVKRCTEIPLAKLLLLSIYAGVYVSFGGFVATSVVSILPGVQSPLLLAIITAASSRASEFMQPTAKCCMQQQQLNPHATYILVWLLRSPWLSSPFLQAAWTTHSCAVHAAHGILE
jgi:hypothetical protein